ncbi:hypothetical protein M569_06979 [Genlisea aurea]|uniref:Uncharacterized protein n=1 Tax=Genlisea aurea TaxID=192259 RepID=S8CM27_9LAMI|nr:hypothetical protein M569_06979 [Genlisea aurea]
MKTIRKGQAVIDCILESFPDGTEVDVLTDPPGPSMAWPSSFLLSVDMVRVEYECNFDPPVPMRSDSSRGITSFLYSAKRWYPPKVLLQKEGTLLAFHNGKLRSSFDISFDQLGVTAPEYSSINMCTEV